MNRRLQEGVDRSSWTSESDEKEAKFMGGSRQDRKHGRGTGWRTARLLAGNGTAAIVTKFLLPRTFKSV